METVEVAQEVTQSVDISTLIDLLNIIHNDFLEFSTIVIALLIMIFFTILVSQILKS